MQQTRVVPVGLVQMVPTRKGRRGFPFSMFVWAGRLRVGERTVTAYLLVTTLNIYTRARRRSDLQIVGLRRIRIVSAHTAGDAPITFAGVNGRRLGGRGFKRSLPCLLDVAPSTVAADSTNTKINCAALEIHKASNAHVGIATGNVPVGSTRDRAMF